MAADGWDLVLAHWPAYDKRLGLEGAVDDPERIAPGSRAAAAAREQLEAAAVCLRSIRSDRDIIDFIAEEGRRIGRDSDLRPTISVSRMMQRLLVLVLSEDATHRAPAMPIEELRRFVIPVHLFWRDLQTDLASAGTGARGSPYASPRSV